MATVGSDSGRGPRRSARGAWIALAVALYAATRVAAVYTVAANWDEFVLLDRAATTAETGVLAGGGRPGLATLLLLPFAAGCDDEIAALRHARLLWTAVTLAFLLGLGMLLGRFAAAERGGRTPGPDAWLGVGLLAFVPAFLEWSVQLRSDQLALAFGVWGAVALLASERRTAWAALAGGLFALGYLATQKLLYVGALAALLALAQLWLVRDFRPKREALRAAACAGVMLGVVAIFQAATTAALEVPAPQRALTALSTPGSAAAQISEFEYYRNTIGFDQYRAILPTLVPHALLLGALVVASAAAIAKRRRAKLLVVAWAVLALGLVVAIFHASAFAYFWMTLGLFPAVALAIAAPQLREALPEARRGLVPLATAGLWLVLGVQGFARIALLSIDTQSVQRESLTFLHRNFGDDAIGFHPERAPFCRRETNPMRLYFSQVIYRHFAGDRREQYTQRLLQDLRERPVQYVVQSFRLNQFPVEVRRFLADNYQPYRASVFVAGRRLSGPSGGRSEFELIVPGHYRWLPLGAATPIRIGKRLLAPGDTIELAAGDHEVEFVDDVAEGMLVLAVDDPPTTAPLAFYKAY
jgi:hypothetical protein